MFQLQWYRLYKIIKYHTLSIFLLEDLNKNIFLWLINGDSLINVRIPKGTTLTPMWSSPKCQARLHKANIKLVSTKVLKILDMKDNIPPIYAELETISNQEWNKQERKNKQIGVRQSL